MAGLWTGDEQSYVLLGEKQYRKDQWISENGNVSVFSVRDDKNAEERKIVTRILLDSTLFECKNDSLIERMTKIHERFQQILDEFSVLKEMAQKEKGIAAYEEFYYSVQEEPYRICIDLVSEYRESILQAGYYKKPASMKHGEVLRLALMLCEAAKKSQEYGMLHRAICPDAIMMDASENYILGHSGFWKKGCEPADAYSLRERSYIAPELFYKKEKNAIIHFENIDEQTEIYSIGAVLYEILNGNHGLFMEECSSETEAEARRLAGEIPPVSRTGTKRLGLCIQKACSPREVRYKNLNELICELRDIYEKMPFNWKEETINGSFYDDTKRTIDASGKQQKDEEKSVEQKKETESGTGKRGKHKKERKEPGSVDYGGMTEEQLNGATKKMKFAVTALLVGLAAGVIILFLVFSNQKEDEIEKMIENRTYAIAMKEIKELAEKEDSVDGLCKTFVDACLQSGDAQRIPEAVELMSDAVEEDYYIEVLDELVSMNKNRVLKKVVDILEEKHPQMQQLIQEYVK